MPTTRRISVVAALALAGLAWATTPSRDAPRAPDPDAGRRYLLHGDYIGSGIPLALWRAITFGRPPAPWPIPRDGVDPSVPLDMNQFTTPEGAEVVGGVNCLACHGSRFRGDFIVGMGNSLGDWTGPGPDVAPMQAMGSLLLREGSPERIAFDRFLRGAGALRGATTAPFRGVTPAFRIEEVAAARRDPATLAWTDTPQFEIDDRVVATDVPAWWGVKKKAALYYNGMGEGDFARLIQQIGVVMIEDAAHAELILSDMRDLLAYIETLEPPAYPGPIDAALAARGEAVFIASCAECHGTYGDAWTYPTKRVPIDVVGTDPLSAQTIAESGLHEWFNRSWFSADGVTRAAPDLAYVAPPLDGVWATAPYFHNGSVPTLDLVLDSARRPERWRRSFNDADYQLDPPGWRYEVVGPADTDTRTYDATRPGYGAGGHTFGDDLTDDDRRALIEYLKTL